MSFITTRSRYGLRLLADIAEHRSQRVVDLGSVSRRQGVPEKYLAKLVLPLKGAGFVRAVRGAKGGYLLAMLPADLSLLDVVEALEGSLSTIGCLEDPGSCDRVSACRTRGIWAGLDKVIREYLSGKSLADVMGDSTPDYSI